MKEYEIWVGYYNLGQGMNDPTEPNMIGKETASSFESACSICANKLGIGYYDKTNSAPFCGAFYETREEALPSFVTKNRCVIDNTVGFEVTIDYTKPDNECNKEFYNALNKASERVYTNNNLK